MDLERIADSFWHPDNDPAGMCSDFLNQITSASDAWLTMPELRAIEDHAKQISSTEPITLGFDGSGRPEDRHSGCNGPDRLLGDATAPVQGRDLEPARRPCRRRLAAAPPRSRADRARRFRAVQCGGFYADPSAGWAQGREGLGGTLLAPACAPRSASEPIRYPQRNVAKTCENFAQLLSAIHQERITYDGDPMITAHLLNARKSPRQSGVRPR